MRLHDDEMGELRTQLEARPGFDDPLWGRWVYQLNMLVTHISEGAIPIDVDERARVRDQLRAWMVELPSSQGLARLALLGLASLYYK